jgi:flavin reductase (DIM6/NTAB) family NADH-FMN oxidoreductase RutF
MTPHHTTIPMPTPDADAESFRETMRFMASPISIVTALDEQGYPRGLTCSALCSLSMAPPSLLICVNRQNRSLDAIRHSGGFMVNLLKAGRAETSDTFASSLPTKFANTKWQPSPISGLPLLPGDALAYVDCGLQAEIDTGSHAILVGLVRGSETTAPGEGPLVYWCRNYGQWISHDLPEDAAARIAMASVEGVAAISAAKPTAS